MNWISGLSTEEKLEKEQDNCSAYQAGIIGLTEFTLCLAKLGYNATDIAEKERQYRPPPPENSDDGDG